MEQADLDRLNQEGHWSFHRFRDDKPMPNHERVADKVFESRKFPVLQDDLIGATSDLKARYQPQQANDYSNGKSKNLGKREFDDVKPWEALAGSDEQPSKTKQRRYTSDDESA